MTDQMWGSHPAGIEVGALFESRHAVAAAGIHRATQAGIVGTGATGAESIVISGGYEDDEDYGDVIIYTGHGGNNPATGRQVADQSFESPGNAALLTSSLTGAPVRVVRRITPPSTGKASYRYDGLFRVESSWPEIGRSGYQVCRFRLVSTTMAESTAAALISTETELVSAPAGTAVPGRVSMVVQRIVRSSAVAEHVKKLHDHVCQVCSTRLIIRGRAYSEAAHIRAIGRPHDGPDVPSNILCLCPNCHVLFDNGALAITADLMVRRMDGAESPLRVVAKHHIDTNHISYHCAIHFQGPA